MWGGSWMVRLSALRLPSFLRRKKRFRGFVCNDSGAKARRENGSSLPAPAKQSSAYCVGWIPAYAGMSGKSKPRSLRKTIQNKETHIALITLSRPADARRVAGIAATSAP